MTFSQWASIFLFHRHCVSRFYLIAVILLFAQRSRGQNMLENGSAEYNKSCPHSYESVSRAEVIPHWLSPDFGTPDYYHRCAGEEVGIPKNWAGIAEPVHGDAYLGIYVWRISGYRENLIVELSKPLTKDSTYSIGGYLKHAIRSEFAYQTIDMALSEALLSIDPVTMISNDSIGKTYKILPPGRSGWSLIQAEYVASGGESYFTIGKFLLDSRVDTVRSKFIHLMEKEPQLLKASYYYLDSVFVVPKFQVQPTEVVFSDMNFVFDRWELSNDATCRLDSLWEEIAKSSHSLQIEGHTDNIGTQKYNYDLSEKRAWSVGQYLIEKGLEPKRLKVIASGDSQPLTDNNTEESRSRNRRVVIKFILD